MGAAGEGAKTGLMMMLYSGRESGAGTNKYENGAGQVNNTICVYVVFYAPARLSEAELNLLTRRASSATLNAHGTATQLGWEPDMRRNVPTAPLVVCSTRSGKCEKKTGPPENMPKNKKLIFYVWKHYKN